MRTESYAWSIYGADPANPRCKVIANITDDSHNPPQWQEELEGRRKEEALAVIRADMATANATGSYTTSIINDDLRWYWRTIQPSGRSRWEVMLDEGGNPLPNPCEDAPPPPPPDPRNVSVGLVNSVLSIEYQGQEVTMTLKGTAIPPTT